MEQHSEFLTINKLTKEQYDAAKEAGQLNQYELYMTPDTEVSAIPTKTSQLENDSGFITSADIPSQEIKLEEGYLYYVASGLTTGNIRNTVKFYDSGDISEYGELLGEEKLGRFNKIKIPAGTKQVKFEQAVDITVKEGNNAYITYKDITRKVVSSSGDWTVLHLEVADVVESGGSDYVIKTVTPTESGSKLTCSVDNYAVNVIDLSSDTPLDINLPSYSGDEIRDFVIRLNVTSTTVPTVAFIPPTGESILFESDDTSWAEIETGANIISFSETQRG